MNQFRLEPPPHLISSTDIISKYGTIRLNWFEQAVIRVSIGAFEPADRRLAIRRFMPPHPEGQHLVTQILAYFQGKKIDFAQPPFERLGTDFQVKVWHAIAKIPYGRCLSYGNLAQVIGVPADNARAVANACGQNPLLILIPCHRVVASTGVLTGYSAGIPWKQALLELEGVPIQNGRVNIPQKRPN